MNNTIKCKYCGKEIELTEAFTHQVKEQILASVEARHRKENEELVKKVEKSIREKSQQEFELKIKDKENEIKELRNRIKEMTEQFLQLNKTIRQLKEQDERRELKFERMMSQERERMKSEIAKTEEEKTKLKIAELNKKLSDMEKMLIEAQRKAQQGSQQLQGEVLELNFEQSLKESFPSDKIEPVEKGVRGADIRQIVKSPRGIVCGVILWETKRTKAWVDKWISKLKDDLRAEKANVPVIVSQVLPKDINSELGFKHGVWVVSFTLALPLALLLRKNLLDVGFQKAVSSHRGKKADHLYEYITSHEFRQQIEAIVETYTEIKQQITKEKAVLERIWKVREKQADRLLTSTARVVGSIQGEVGERALPVKGLDLLELESPASKKLEQLQVSRLRRIT